MRTLYYTEEIDIILINNEPHIGKKKVIRVYDIDTQFISMVELYGFSIQITSDTEYHINIKIKADYSEETEVNLIKL